jgi:hypothetical protein
MKRQHANKILTANDNLGIALSTFVIYALHDSGIDQRRQQLHWEGVIAERLPLVYGTNLSTAFTTDAKSPLVAIAIARKGLKRCRLVATYLPQTHLQWHANSIYSVTPFSS